MSSIATKTGDRGQTSLVGGLRVSKASLRVESYGNVDELNATMGFARSICDDLEVCESTKRIQRELFQLGAALATPPEARKAAPSPVTEAMVEALTTQVHALESVEGILSDWSVPGEHSAAAAYDIARTVCRRAERSLVRSMESGESVEPVVLAYLNRLSDLLWLFGRKLEMRAGVDDSGKLRAINAKSGPRWSKAW
jgi:cob(I)alamin adenosyltransferase